MTPLDTTHSRRAIDEQFETHMHQEELRNATQDERLKKIETSISNMETSISGLLSAWNAANAIGNFLKWTAGIGAGIAVLLELFRHGGK